MSQIKLHKALSGLLIFVLFSSSSLALEMINHQSHQNLNPHGLHAMHDLATASDPATALETMEASDEGCICEEICGSIDFSFSTVDVQYTINDPSSPDFPRFYQSISLDLLLPPPTL